MAVTSFRKYGNRVVPKLLEKVDTLSIVDDVVSGGTNVPLSANQGKLLNQAINNEAAARIQAIVDIKGGVGSSYNTLNKLGLAVDKEIADRASAVDAERGLREASVTAEENRAKAAETAISDSISNKIITTQAELDAIRAEIAAASGGSSTALESEVTRAKAAEASLQSQVDSEVIARSTAVTELNTLLSSETQNRTNQDVAIGNRIGLLEQAVATGIVWKQSFESVSEMGSALNESQVISGWSYYIKLERDMYIVIDGVDGDYKPEAWTTKSLVKIADFNEISQLVQGEKIRAVAKEAELQVNIDTEVQNRTNADVALDLKIKNESDRAVASEKALSDLIAKEVQDRIDALSGEATARDNADKAISADVLAKYNETKALIEAETTRAKESEGVLNGRIYSVVTDMTNREAAMDERMDKVEGDETTNGSVKKALFDAKAYADSMVLRPRTIGRDGFTVIVGDQFALPLVPADGVNGILYGEVIVYKDNEALSVQVANVVGTSVSLMVGSSGEFDGSNVVCHFFYRNIDQGGGGQGGAGTGGAGA